MPNKLEKWNFIGGEEGFDFVKPENLSNAAQRIAAAFQKKVEQKARLYKVVDSGDMIRDMEVKKTIGDNSVLVEIFMAYYSDFVNQGVKGWGSSKNAPNSPYQFKSKGMNDEGRKSIIARIKRGNALLKDKSKTKVKKGLEKKYKLTGKKKSAIDKAADRMIWNIKKYGIKETGFLNEAFNETIAENEEILMNAAMADFFVKLKEEK
jgi:hypothetical protein